MEKSEPAQKKQRIESLFSVPPSQAAQRTPEEIKAAFDAAVKSHPFFDSSHFRVNIADDAVFRDAKGNLVGILLRQAFPETAVALAANVLRPAATRTSLRANIFGGEAPFSGIAGYYDYMGSPIEHKCRKTSFTCEVINQWKDVFPLVDYASELYKAACPAAWTAQMSAVPDAVKIHHSPFSTLTINQRFRTAKHTDAGDFDAGFGLLTVLEGTYAGLHLGLTDFKVAFTLRPRDLLIFNTHHFHCNTELEKKLKPHEDWNRLTCVFYYRVALGEHFCIENYQRRLKAAPRGSTAFTKVTETNNGENFNRPSAVFHVKLSPFNLTASLTKCKTAQNHYHVLHAFITNNPAFAFDLFGVHLRTCNGLPPRKTAELSDIMPSTTMLRAQSKLGGFSENTVDKALHLHTLLSEESLEANISADLHVMWKDSKQDWMKLVARDWKEMVNRNKDRTDFSWKNKSDMNSRFFDLCDVAEQVMLTILASEVATPAQAASFWACFASHLHLACHHDLHMPIEAMSLKKLNVKLKDYTFGGTRYFHDMPPEERERRLLRKKRLEEARRNGAQSGVGDGNANWLANDTFDYQSENCDVQYAERGMITPAANALAIVGSVPVQSSTKLDPVEVPSTGLSVKVLLIIPSVPLGGAVPRAAQATTSPLELEEQLRIAQYVFKEPQLTSEERSPTRSRAVEMLEEVPGGTIDAASVDAAPKETPNAFKIPAVITVTENITLTVCDHASLPAEKTAFDVVIVRDVMSHLASDIDLKEFWKCLSERVSVRDGLVLVVDTDLDDRSYFLLQNDRFDAYNAVRESAFSRQHEARSPVLRFSRGVEQPKKLRSQAGLRNALRDECGVAVLAAFSFDGAPLNSVCLSCKLPQ